LTANFNLFLVNFCLQQIYWWSWCEWCRGRTPLSWQPYWDRRSLGTCQGSGYRHSKLCLLHQKRWFRFN